MTAPTSHLIFQTARNQGKSLNMAIRGRQRRSIASGGGAAITGSPYYASRSSGMIPYTANNAVQVGTLNNNNKFAIGTHPISERIDDLINSGFISEFKEVLTRHGNFIFDNFGARDFFIAGSLFPCLMHGLEPSDVDIYFKTEEAIDRFINLMNDDENARAFIIQVTRGYEHIMPAEFNNKTLKKTSAVTFKCSNVKYNFIFFKHGDPEVIVSNFDMGFLTWFYSHQENELSITPEAWEQAAYKRIVSNPDRNFRISENRILRYRERGFIPYIKDRQIIMYRVSSDGKELSVELTQNMCDDPYELKTAFNTEVLIPTPPPVLNIPPILQPTVPPITNPIQPVKVGVGVPSWRDFIANYKGHGIVNKVLTYMKSKNIV